MRTTELCFCVLTVIGLTSIQAPAATVDVPSTFGDGGSPTPDDWTFLDGAAVADAGDMGVGDHALNYIAPDQSNFHALNFSSPQFLGDYTGVVSLEFKARHTGQGDGVDLRAYFFNGTFFGGGDHALSSQVVSISPNETAWQTYSVDITPADLTLIQGTLGGLLSNVTQIGLRHDPAGLGATMQNRLPNGASVYFDDIVLRGVPEPTCGCLTLLACLTVAGSCRRRAA